MKQSRMYLTGPEHLELREEIVPHPKHGEMLVQIQAATTCGTDVKVYKRGGHPRMLEVPTPFGHEFAGTVAQVGAEVRYFREGDRVVVANSAPCESCSYCAAGRENLCADLQYLNGAFAQYLLIPPRFVEKSTHLIGREVPFEVAALTEPLACVIHGVAACELAKNSEVLVYGAGPIGLLLTATLQVQGHHVVVADPNPGRLEVACRLGAGHTVRVERGGGQATMVRAHSSDRQGFHCAIDATGVPEVWQDAISCVRPGGVVNLFGGCAPGTKIELDTHLVHYSELTIKGVYHHRPATVLQALHMLTCRAFDPTLLLSREMPLDSLQSALGSMIAKESLKVVIRPPQ